MSLTMPPGPLSDPKPTNVNYTVVGPDHLLLRTPFPRRVRAYLEGRTVLDTVCGSLVHESELEPALFVPIGDIDTDLLTRTTTSTHCPFKGNAAYWTVAVGDRVADDVAWGYENSAMAWLNGLLSFSWDHLDHWFDEDEEVFAHLRDPYHRVDVRSTSRSVLVEVGGVTVAESSKAMLLSETGVVNRWYIPRDDVQMALLDSSSTTTHCPYKGQSTYWSVSGGASDVAWSYEDPFDDARRIAGHLSFDGESVTVRTG